MASEERQVMPYLKSATFERLRLAGQHMSNLCFNLWQHERCDGDRATMKECQIAWDEALKEARGEIKQRKALSREAPKKEVR